MPQLTPEQWAGFTQQQRDKFLRDLVALDKRLAVKYSDVDAIATYNKEPKQ